MTVEQMKIGSTLHTRWTFATKAEAQAWAKTWKPSGSIGRLRRLPDGRYAYGSDALDAA